VESKLVIIRRPGLRRFRPRVTDIERRMRPGEGDKDESQRMNTSWDS
jgi:hypothetical protein